MSARPRALSNAGCYARAMLRGLTFTLSLFSLLLAGCAKDDPDADDGSSTDGAATSGDTTGGDGGTDGDASDDGGTGGTDGGSSTGEGSSDAGSSGSGGSGSETGGSDTSAPADACDTIDGKTYTSLEQMECGLGPMGPVPCNWTITFTAGDWEWAYSDVIETGTYTCSGNDIDGGTYGGSLDPTTGILTWEGAEYESG